MSEHCSSCGAELLERAKFCSKCGRAVVIPPPEEAAPPRESVEPPREGTEEETTAVEQPPVEPPRIQPAPQVARPARPELYERRRAERTLPSTRPRRRWLRNLVVLAVAVVALGGAAGALFLLGFWPGTDDGETQSVELVAENMAFSPREIRVDPGRDVRIHFVNEDDGIHHQFVLYGDGSNSPLVEGKVVVGRGEDSITFSPPPVGHYVFQCGVHPEMKGTLIVEGEHASPTPTFTATVAPPGTPTPTPTPTPLTLRYGIVARVWPECLNLRPDASTQNEPITCLWEGERLELVSGPTLSDEWHWWSVRLTDGTEGFSAGKYLLFSYATFRIGEEDNTGIAVLAIRDADILEDGSLLLSLSFTNVSAANVRWESDVGDPNIYLTDESGNRYASLEVGGAFAADLPDGLKPNETLTGWHRFSAPPDLLDRLSTNTLGTVGSLTLHYPNHEPIVFNLR